MWSSSLSVPALLSDSASKDSYGFIQQAALSLKYVISIVLLMFLWLFSSQCKG